ncbi:MAG: 2Fe-2S iron-sulfur cluster-binding protein [Phycisphaerales bacterium JB065]
MPRITYEGKTIPLEPGQTVLDAAHASGIALPCSCRNGVCQSCLVKTDAGTAPPPGSQKGLKPSLVQRGYFLACIAHPTEDLAFAAPDAEAGSIAATISAVEPLSPTVVRVRLTPAPGAADALREYRAGQFITVLREDGLARSYSIANIPSVDGEIEVHVRRIEGGRMSSWLCDDSPVGAAVQLRGPAGDCFYLGDRAEPLLLVGTGTGLAPLVGITKDALARDHLAPIHLYHGALHPGGLYFQSELRDLEAAYPNLRVTLCTLEGDSDAEDPIAPDAIGKLDDLVLERTTDLPDQRAYICGDPGFVHSFRKRLFIAGARMNAIHADAFEIAPPPNGTTQPCA